MAADAAQSALESSSLRWSAADRLGDPFELNSRSELGFDASSLLTSTIKLASSMIFAPEEPKGDSPLINAINRWREEERFASAEEAHNVLRELLSKMVDYRASQLASSMNQWQDFVRNTRFCCFCASGHNIAAWQKFAQNHTGIALKFDTGEYSPFQNLKPVVYQAERPEFTTLREQLGAILHNRKDNVVERFSDHHFVKAQVFKNEEEWRCSKKAATPVQIDDDQIENWFDDVAFKPNDLAGVFIGLNTNEDVRNNIIAKIKSDYANTPVYQAIKSKSGFNIDFEKIKLK